MILDNGLQLKHLDSLPISDKKRIALHVKPAAERALKTGHPWLFEEGIRKQSREGMAGDLAVIFDRKDKFLAVGLYDPHSQIRVKVLQHGQSANIDGAWFQNKLEVAAAIRNPLQSTETDGYRLIHGENDGLPGLVVDRYADTLVVKLYTTAWIPYLVVILPCLLKIQPATRLILRMSRNVQDEPDSLFGLVDGMALVGDLPAEPIIFVENGLRFAADVVHGHKTGFFFDQRENRQRVKEITNGKTVLDVFAYSGGFSVYAAGGGAKSVLSLDVSRPALETAQRNMALNANRAEIAAVNHEILVNDAFIALERFRRDSRSFDVVVIDPPSFAKQQSEIEGALRSYRQLAVLGKSVVRDDGLLVMASCSSRVSSEVFFGVLRDEFGAAKVVQTGHALDHPIGFPEGAYLKCGFFTFRRSL